MSRARKDLVVTVCGGGNGAHCSVGYIGHHADVKVNVLTTKPEKWSDSIKLTTATSTWADRGDFIGKINKCSDDAAEVIPESDVVLVAAPAHVHGPILRKVAGHVKEGAMVGTIFAQGGFDWIARDALGPEGMAKVKAIFGLQNIPWICKTTHYGSESRLLGPKKSLDVVSYPVEAVDDVASTVESLFDIPTSTIPNFLSVTLTPSNQIIHPARYAAIFHDYDGERTYTHDELKARSGLTLYEDFDALSTEYLARLDNELQIIKEALTAHFPQLNLSAVLPIKERIIKGYGKDVKDTSSLLQVMRTNVGYIGCGTPLTETSDGKFKPNVDSRLYWEDIPYGLCILKGLAEMLGDIPTPTINEMIYWHQQQMGKEYLNPDGNLNPLLTMETGAPSRYGLHALEDVVETSIPHSMMNYRSPTLRAVY